MKRILCFLFLLCAVPVSAADFTYEGVWHTSRNIKLDGRMNCEVDQVGDQKWKGRFFGRWQGRPFSYNVEFSGPPDNLVGQARIDGARYNWKGKIDPHSPGSFDGTFTGTRYTGYFKLKQKVK